MRMLPGLRHAMLIQRGHLFHWVPVCLATGIGSFFSLRFEPTGPMLAGAGALAMALWLLGRHMDEAFRPIPFALVLMLAGALLAAVRAHTVAGPVLGWRYYGPVEGRVVALDRSGSDAVRVTLDRVVMARVSPARTPLRVRVSLHGDGQGDGAGIDPQPGMRVMTTAHLSPPGGPVEPGGFDFQRHAWFNRLGAVGYTRVPLVGLEAAQDGWSLATFRLRMAMSAHIRAALPGDVGGFAAAVTTGDRSGISLRALDTLRASNTAHLLAISGLHMGLLSGFVLGLLRLVLAALPGAALHWPVRKIAAAGALVAASGYLALSGGNVATERAYVMAAVALCAVMLSRRAISLRAVAMAALIVLVLRPEALLGPGFQMSFAATVALVAVFGWMRGGVLSRGPRWIQPLVAVMVSSAVAGLATAPIGAAHFNTVSHYGLLANLASVPLMGLLVVPAAVLALLLAPLGLEGIGLWLMGLGLRWILGVANWVAGLEGARGYVHGPAPWVLPLIALGALVLILWQGRGRFGGLAVMALGFVLWTTADRPAALIAEDGGIVGVMTAQGRALSKEKGAGFVAQNWLENDGDGADQSRAAARWQEGAVADRTKLAKVGQIELVHLIGKRALAGFGPCVGGQMVVVSITPDAPLGNCDVYDPKRLRTTGAIALVQGRDGIHLRTARQVSGDRMWSGWAR
ncbi:ComEC/Rec2 family competence protein [Pseudosulfitobacter pseudonitzschiae]|uniref:ComEC/Rec2 family competence protein n=1 Tax=Pseudosulfitobacter pseudonitzschiae TaxID=1402135 RepID=UPI001AF314B5|nr:ComEC/Rec2 family competence protein [Pseudosulfitobacter pseudonitzschiae]MBM1814418.1 ComEC/Rec2 family competence protein [Pseudosulfitobacter pseudonitzschiae]MBM1831411.1 ComEC/Rec2 family competence protein [Pseudosulfitobacter pseudonitzschiae]MBM1836278.1 ComEC/Rec2 family competence protein [Pseudosulfitobacter pseudonitzschiae]MBM1841124.1 ComEC/Rec2 family competence protein [Pseudosulfitobacter pseudonitzschiae]MBM1845992.1 ComEC/Rec2 family competence protein [Pseudosulfitobact